MGRRERGREEEKEREGGGRGRGEEIESPLSYIDREYKFFILYSTILFC